MEKNRAAAVIAVICIVLGIGVLSFPYILQEMYSANANQTAEEFDDWRTEMYGEEDREVRYLPDLYEQMQKYNEDLYVSGQSGFRDAWSYQKTSFDLTEWGFEENVIGYLDIPRMDIKLPLYLGATEENMRLGAVQLTETSLPIGGDNTNCVIAGHRGYYGAAMFRDIEDLEVGDEIYITNLWEQLTYRVCQMDVIDPSDTHKVKLQESRDLITLVTCHPYRHNYQRYLVYAERIIK